MKIEFRDLAEDEIDIRVGRVINSPKFKGCSLLLYKNARIDMDLLDEVVGKGNWQRSHSRDNANCIVSIWDEEKKQWVGKEDTGTENNTEAAKSIASDSFKRACVNWGIGRGLYSAPNIIVKAELTNDGKKVEARIGWIVKEIHYNKKHKIDKLVIAETEYGKETSVVFSWSLKGNNEAGNGGTTGSNRKKEELSSNAEKPDLGANAPSKRDIIVGMLKGQNKITIDDASKWVRMKFGKNFINDCDDKQFDLLKESIEGALKNNYEGD